MTRNNVRRVVNFRLGVPALSEVDRIAAETGKSRSDVVRMALRITLADQENLRQRLTSIKENV